MARATAWFCAVGGPIAIAVLSLVGPWSCGTNDSSAGAVDAAVDQDAAPGETGAPDTPASKDAAVDGAGGSDATDGGGDAPMDSLGATDAPDGAPTEAGCGSDAGGVDLEWAQWPMPNSPVDVEGGAPNPQSYVDNGDGSITDKVTGLMWQKDVNANFDTQANAVTSCGALKLAGHCDWRLPAFVELYSIVDYGPQPTIDAKVFPSTPGGGYWSSSAVAGHPGFGWLVDFIDGTSNNNSSSVSTFYRCVR